MRNRSPLDLPAIFVRYNENWKNGLVVSDLSPQQLTYLHFHDYVEIGMCFEGSGEFYFEGEKTCYKAGDLQIIFPYQRHFHISDASGSRWSWFSIITSSILSKIGVTDTSCIDALMRNGVSAYGTISKNDFPRTYAAVRKLFEHDRQELLINLVFAERMALDYYNVLLTLVEESRFKPKMELSTGGDKIELIAPALEIIKEAIDNGKDISVQALAASCHSSSANFRKIFHAALGCSPKEYLTACRIRKAKNLLAHSKDSILSISLAVGYHDISGFNRAFLKETGITPTEYRYSQN